MMRLNNKGQSLVLFILFIPMLLGIMALVIDVGNALAIKNNIDNNLEYVLDYGLKNGEVFFENKDKEYYNEELINWKDDLKRLLDYNLSDIKNEIKIDNDVIIITSESYVKGIFSNILNIKGFKVESEYRGYIKDNEQVIEKIK